MLSALRALLCIMVFGAAPIACAEPLRVFTSIKPLQLLAVAVGGDDVDAQALLAPQFSPHDYQLRPSDRAKLDRAQIVFWIGPRLEVFLQPVMRTLSANIAIIELQDGERDAHLWIDPIASIAITQRMATVFSQLRPEHAQIFRDNADRYAVALKQQEIRHREELARLPALRGYMVEHDAYRRFESRYGLKHFAALTDTADLPPSAAAMLNIERQLADGDITCVWREAQESKLLQRLIADKKLHVATIDAMAARIPVGVEGALQFYEEMWWEVMACLTM